MKASVKLIWSKKAKTSLKGIYLYIKKDSPAAAEKVRLKIILQSEKLLLFPEKFSEEELLREVPGNFRSVSIWRYKIVYEIDRDKVVIIDIFDGAQNPDKLKTK